MKNSSRTVWVPAIAIIAAFFPYISVAGRTPEPKPQPHDESPSEEVPSTT